MLVISTNKLYAVDFNDYAHFDVDDYKIVTIENGWNLIPVDLLFSTDDWGDSSVWYFNPTNKKYVDVSGNNNNVVEETDVLGEWLDSINLNESVYEVSVPVWFYKQNSKISFEPDYRSFLPKLLEGFMEFASLLSIKFNPSNKPLENLYKGWNLLITNPIIIDYPLKECAGSCYGRTSSTYYFNPYRQNLDKVKPNSDGILKNNGKDLPLGGGIALKVSKDCKFDYSSIKSKHQQIPIPSLPNN